MIFVAATTSRTVATKAAEWAAAAVWVSDWRRRAWHRYPDRARPRLLRVRHRSAYPDRRRGNSQRRRPGAELSNRSRVRLGQDRRTDRRDGQHDLGHPRRDRRSLERNLPGQRQVLYRSEDRAVPQRDLCRALRHGAVGDGAVLLPAGTTDFSRYRIFRQVETRFHGCSGNACKFTSAYIIAHEAGHHIQNLLGILPRVTQMQQQADSKAEANALQVKVELQADCLSGVWVNREEKKRPGFLEAGRHRRRADHGVRDRRRHAAASGDGQGGAGLVHARLRRAAQAMVHDRLSTGHRAGLQHLRRGGVVGGEESIDRHGRA